MTSYWVGNTEMVDNFPYAPRETLTTKGDEYVATAAGVLVRRGAPATNGQTYIADSSQANGWSADYPMDRYDAYSRPTGAIAETCPRIGCTISNSAALTSGTLRTVGLMLPANRVVSSISFVSGTTALDTGQNQWFCLLDASRAMVACTADDTNNAWGSNTVKTLNIATIASGASATYTTPSAGLYYLGVMVKAGVAVPSMLAVVGSTTIFSLAPIMSGNSSTGQTTPPAFPFTAGAITGSGSALYGYVS